MSNIIMSPSNSSIMDLDIQTKHKFNDHSIGSKRRNSTLLINTPDSISDNNNVFHSNKKSKKHSSHLNDITLVIEYSNDILKYLYSIEPSFTIKNNYLLDSESEFHIKPAMRAILIDWIIEVHEKFNLNIETLFLTINLLDRFLSNNKVTLNKLQLLTVTCLFISTKFEEVKLPKLADYAYITDGAATKDEIKVAEFYIFKSLDFKISSVSSLNFFNNYLKFFANDKDHLEFEKFKKSALFILEYITCSHLFVTLKPSILAALSIYIANLIFSNTSPNSTSCKDFLRKINQNNETTIDQTKFKELTQKIIDEISSPHTDLSSLVLQFKDAKNEAVFFDVFYWCKDHSA